MCESTDKIDVCLRISGKVYKELNRTILEKYGKIYGHIGKSVEEALKLWIKNQKNGEN